MAPDKSRHRVFRNLRNDIVYTQNTHVTTVPSKGAVQLEQVAVCLHPQDDVAIAKIDLQEGLILEQDVTGRRPARVSINQAFSNEGNPVSLALSSERQRRPE